MWSNFYYLDHLNTNITSFFLDEFILPNLKKSLLGFFLLTIYKYKHTQAYISGIDCKIGRIILQINTFKTYINLRISRALDPASSMRLGSVSQIANNRYTFWPLLSFRKVYFFLFC